MARGDEYGTLALLVPSFEPDRRLVALMGALGGRGFGVVVVVDDGSTPRCAPIFAELHAFPGVRLLRHERNRGKGAALKTGIATLLAQYPACRGVVTADGDGQHRPADIERVAGALLAGCGRAVLGVRAMGGGVPWRSRVGNEFTRRLFARQTGSDGLSDTQSGLRGLPRELWPELLRIPGERYEYEMAVLRRLCISGRRPLEVNVATVYLEGNRSSHFRPLRDSGRVLGSLLWKSALSCERTGEADGVGMAAHPESAKRPAAREKSRTRAA